MIYCPGYAGVDGNERNMIKLQQKLSYQETSKWTDKTYINPSRQKIEESA